jgi:DNA-binding beta-propeller fold protein YncE
MRMVIAVALLLGACARPQREVEAVNQAPNPYRTVRDWARMPPGFRWAAVTAVEPAPDGSIYVVHRCFENSCAGRTEDPILKFDRHGRLLKSWGSGMFVFPHGGTVDAQGNLWITDANGANGIGHQAIKFNPEGQVLMRLGKAGVAGAGPDTFNRPTDVAIAPNGDIYVADGHRPDGNNRIVVFSPNGTYLREFGRKGSAPGELNEPHTIAFDAEGRLYVGDRVNNRVQIFDAATGAPLAEWKQFGRPSGIAIVGDTIYVTDSESGPDHGFGELPQWKKGIRIGSIRDGRVKYFIEDLESDSPEHSGAEGIGVDAAGNVWGAVVRRQMLEVHIPQHP